MMKNVALMSLTLTWYGHDRLIHKSSCLMITDHLACSMELCWLSCAVPIDSFIQFLPVPDTHCLPGWWASWHCLKGLTEFALGLHLDLCMENSIALNLSIFLFQRVKVVSPLTSAQTHIFLLPLGWHCLYYWERSFAGISGRDHTNFPLPLASIKSFIRTSWLCSILRITEQPELKGPTKIFKSNSWPCKGHSWNRPLASIFQLNVLWLA